MPKVKKIYTKVLYVSVTPEADAWIRKRTKYIRQSKSKYVDELLKKDQKHYEGKGKMSARLTNFG